jgi:DNA repair protein RadC
LTGQFDPEETPVLVLNSKNRTIYEGLPYRRTISEIYIRIADIFKAAVKVNAAGLVLSHPSTDPELSPQISIVTRQVQEAAKVLNISFEDHIIVGGSVGVAAGSGFWI